MKVFKAIVLVLSFALIGCASTQKWNMAPVSPFLADVKGKLTKGKDGQAQLVYINPEADLSAYHQVIVSPVQLIVTKDSGLEKISDKNRQAIANWAYTAFETALSTDLTPTTTVQPGTLQVQIAITDASSSDVVMDTITSIIPQTRLLSGLYDLITGDEPFTGDIRAEGRITDASTGELLMAGADSRQGTKNLSGVTDSWNDVEKSLQFFAQRLAYNICQAQKHENCKEPKN